MAITRTTDTDDNGTGTTGTIHNNAWKQAIYDQIDALVGDGTNVTFAAGNFTAGGSMTWTLTSGDQITYRYQIVNKQMTVWFGLETTTVGGTPHAELRIAIPASKTCPVQVAGDFTYQVSGVDSRGFMQINAGGTYIRLLKEQAGSSTWANSTNLTSVWGWITFPIN